MRYNKLVNFVPESKIDLALNYYKVKEDGRKRRVFTLEHPANASITNKKRFCDAVVNTFPLDPIIVKKPDYNLDALQDSLHGGLVSLEDELLDIIWHRVDLVTRESIPTLVEGVMFLLSAIKMFSNHFWGRRNVYTRLMLTYQEGQPGFPEKGWDLE